MNTAALIARLTALGYRRASHGPAAHPETWLYRDGPAGTVRVITDPAGDCTQISGLGPRPALPVIFDIWLSASAPDTVTAGTLNAAEAWLAAPAPPPRAQAASPPPSSPPRATGQTP
jgi:hypothetical protein